MLRPINEYRNKVLKPEFEPYREDITPIETDLAKLSKKRQFPILVDEVINKDLLLYMIDKFIIDIHALMTDVNFIVYVDKYWVEIMEIVEQPLYKKRFNTKNERHDLTDAIYFTDKNIQIITNHWNWFVDLHNRDYDMFNNIFNRLYISKNTLNHCAVKAFFKLIDDNIQWFIDKKLLDNHICTNGYFLPILEKHVDLLLDIEWEHLVCMNTKSDLDVDRVFNIIKRVDKSYWTEKIETLLVNTNRQHHTCLCKLIDYHWDYFIETDSIEWFAFCFHPGMIDIIRTKLDYLILTNKISWEGICYNANAIDIIDKYWNTIFINTSDQLSTRLYYLMRNNNSIKLFKKHINAFRQWNEDNVEWKLHVSIACINDKDNYYLYEVFKIIDDNWGPNNLIQPKNISLADIMCYHPRVNILQLYLKIINDIIADYDIDITTVWHCLANNTVIYYDEYEVACRAYFRRSVAEELMSVVWHPRNISRFPALGYATDA